MKDEFSNMLIEIGLLKKYMEHVIDCEGISFLDSFYGAPPILTEQELKRLRDIEAEIIADMNK